MIDDRLSSKILTVLVEHGMTETNGAKVSRIDCAKVLDAFAIISASLIATSPEAGTPLGIKRILRRQARQLENQVLEFRRVCADKGMPFGVEVA